MTREPALHFLTAGALAALFVHILGGGPPNRGDEDKDAAVPLAQERPTILVEPATVAQLQAKRSAMDPASRPALTAMIEGWIDEEVLVREAKRLAKDHEDDNSRPRTVQWMRSVLEARVHVAEPDETTLRRHYARHQDAFTGQPRYDFELVALAPPASVDARREALDAALTSLDAGLAPSTLTGARFDRWERMRAATVARAFGPRVREVVEAATLGTWRVLEDHARPTLLRVLAAQPGGDVLPFDAIRARVRLHHRRQVINEGVADQVRAARRAYAVSLPSPTRATPAP